MANERTRIKDLHKNKCPVFYFYSSQQALAERACLKAKQLLAESGIEDTETTVLEGPTPDVEQIIMAAGTISFFSTRRIVELPNFNPATYSDKDFELLCEALSSAENAVFFITSTFEEQWGRLQLSKKVQNFATECKKIGYVEEVKQLTGKELSNVLIERASEKGANLPLDVATKLIERCGAELFLLEQEVDKLCALANYDTITANMITQISVQNLEADVFEMIQMLTTNRVTQALKKLQTLILLQEEPIAITAALIGSYTDMYRVRLGQNKGRMYSEVFKDFGYKGKDFRLKKALDASRGYSLSQLEKCIDILLQTDKSLKSQPVSKQILLETAVCSLAAMRQVR